MCTAIPLARGTALWRQAELATRDDPAAKAKAGCLEPHLADVTEGYAWHDIATWKPNGGETFYLAPPAAGADGKPSVEAVWLDCIELSWVPEEAR